MRSIVRLATVLILVLCSVHARAASAQSVDITNVSGLVTLSDAYAARDSIRLYNADGTLWYLFSYFYDDKDGQWDFPNDAFKPLAFHPDFFVLGLAVTRRDRRGYEVVVNHETGLTKRLPAAPFLKLQTWRQYLLSVFALDFDPEQNALRVAPDDRARTLAYPGKSFVYQPVEVKGEWVRVAYSKDPADVSELRKAPSGWIRWRRANRLVVSFFYTA